MTTTTNAPIIRLIPTLDALKAQFDDVLSKLSTKEQIDVLTALQTIWLAVENEDERRAILENFLHVYRS